MGFRLYIISVEDLVSVANNINKKLLKLQHGQGELTFLSVVLGFSSAAMQNVISGRNSKHNMLVISKIFIRNCAVETF